MKARAHVNYGVAFYRDVQNYDKAIEEAEIALSLGKKGDDEYGVATQLIIASYAQKHDYEKAIQRGEELMAAYPFATSDGSVVPLIALNLAEVYLKTNQHEKAFAWTMRAFDYIRRLVLPTEDFFLEKKEGISAMQRILTASADKNVDFNGDGKPDPGDLSIGTWIAQELLDMGERQMAKELLEQLLFQNPEEPESRKRLEAIQEEDSLNQIQKSKWNFAQKYVYQPFSRFNFSVAVAFIVQEKKLPSFCMKVGERLLDDALLLRPDAADAHLLKGYYYFGRNEIEKAIVEARRSLELDKDYAQAWFGLGSFALEANQTDEAIAAFQKTLELYPGYSKRQYVMNLIEQLRGQGVSD